VLWGRFHDLRDVGGEFQFPGEQYYLCSISVRLGDAGDAVASPAVKNWSLFGQKFSKFGQSIQLHLQVSEVVSISQTKAKQ